MKKTGQLLGTGVGFVAFGIQTPVFLHQSFNLASVFGFTNFIRFQCVMNNAKKVNGRVQAGINMYQHVSSIFQYQPGFRSPAGGESLWFCVG